VEVVEKKAVLQQLLKAHPLHLQPQKVKGCKVRLLRRRKRPGKRQKFGA
jgi:hypothetical protein